MNMSIAGLCKELKNRQRVREGFDDDKNKDAAIAVLGVTTVVISVALLVSLVIWIWALVVTVKYWNVLPPWAQVVSVLGLLPVVPMGQIVSLVVVYIGKAGKRKR